MPEPEPAQHSAYERTLAFHEAGHAVIGILRGHTLRSASIDRSTGQNPVCSWFPPLGPDQGSLDLWLGGALAGDRFVEEFDGEPQTVVGLRDDLSNALSTAADMATNPIEDHERNLHFVRGVVRVCLELRRPEVWGKVSLVAALLLRETTIADGERIAAIVRGDGK